MWFEGVISCRRRLAKRHEKTPLRQLFLHDDASSFAKYGAMVARVRAGMAARKLQVQDAFMWVDVDHNGLISLDEVFGMLEWLKMFDTPSAERRTRRGAEAAHSRPLEETVFLLRSISHEAHLSYAEFVTLLEPDGIQLGLVGCTALGEQALAPAHAQELLDMLQSQMATKQAKYAELEAAEAITLVRMRARLDKQMRSRDFSWMRQRGGSNPTTTLAACLYDFTRGEAGTQRNAPGWLDAHGEWLFCRAGSARVPCAKLRAGSVIVDADRSHAHLQVTHDAHFVLRVPFRKNGGGARLNQFTVTLVAKIKDCYMERVLMSPSPRCGDVVTDCGLQDQLVGALDFENGGVMDHRPCPDPPELTEDEWHVISMAVDVVSSTITHYIDGKIASIVKGSGADDTFHLELDGGNSISSRIAVLGPYNDVGHWFETECEERTKESGDYYLRSVAIHSRTLSSEQVKHEAAALRAMLIEDAIAQLPFELQTPMSASHAKEPIVSTSGVLREANELRRQSMKRVGAIWLSLREGQGPQLLEELLEALEPHDLPLCKEWVAPDTGESEWRAATAAMVDEYGGTLLILAAASGSVKLVERLLHAGANIARREGGCTALHAAAGMAELPACQMLIDAHAPIEARDTMGRTALRVACDKGCQEASRSLQPPPLLQATLATPHLLLDNVPAGCPSTGRCWRRSSPSRR